MHRLPKWHSRVYLMHDNDDDGDADDDDDAWVCERCGGAHNSPRRAHAGTRLQPNIKYADRLKSCACACCVCAHAKYTHTHKRLWDLKWFLDIRFYVCTVPVLTQNYRFCLLYYYMVAHTHTHTHTRHARVGFKWLYKFYDPVCAQLFGFTHGEISKPKLISRILFDVGDSTSLPTVLAMLRIQTARTKRLRLRLRAARETL